MNKHWKIIISLLFALAIVLGVAKRQSNPYLGWHKQSFYSPTADPSKSLADYYRQAQELAAAPSQTATTTLLAVGDIMLSRNVALAIQKAGDINLPFEKTADILKSTDFNFANLESPIAPSLKALVGGHSMVFAAPSNNVAALADYNFKIINLANNHAFDQGLGGIDITKTALDNLGIAHEGTGDNLDEAWQPAIVKAQGLKICFVGASYASINNGGQTTNNYVARMEDFDKLKLAITTAKSECDFVVTSMHAGTEYTRTPNAEQIAFAHAAIDDGADLVVGSHPHWVQTMEKYQNKYIFYSLGNFIFDQMWSRETKEGLTLKISISKNDCHPAPDAGSSLDSGSRAGMTCGEGLQGNRRPAQLDSIELIPVIIENYSTPRRATPEETKNILQKIDVSETILPP